METQNGKELYTAICVSNYIIDKYTDLILFGIEEYGEFEIKLKLDKHIYEENNIKTYSLVISNNAIFIDIDSKDILYIIKGDIIFSLYKYPTHSDNAISNYEYYMRDRIYPEYNEYVKGIADRSIKALLEENESYKSFIQNSAIINAINHIKEKFQ